MSALVAKELQEQNKLLERLIGNYILDKIHPVGSIYISENNSNPESLFGGTWERIKDRFLLSAGDTYAAGVEGGSKIHSHSAGSLFAAMRATQEYLWYQDKSATNHIQETRLSFGTEYKKETTSGVNSLWSSSGVAVDGNTEEASNMPPYLTVYMWRRTA